MAISACMQLRTVVRVALVVCSSIFASCSMFTIGVNDLSTDMKHVKELVPLPDFIPGMGRLYVDPKTLPAGPYAAFQKDGTLVSTMYMVPLEDMNNEVDFHDLPEIGKKVKSVDIHFNSGHSGVAVPHYHIVIWHIDKNKRKLSIND